MTTVLIFLFTFAVENVNPKCDCYEEIFTVVAATRVGADYFTG